MKDHHDAVTNTGGGNEMNRQRDTDGAKDRAVIALLERYWQDCHAVTTQLKQLDDITVSESTEDQIEALVYLAYDFGFSVNDHPIAELMRDELSAALVAKGTGASVDQNVERYMTAVQQSGPTPNVPEVVGRAFCEATGLRDVAVQLIAASVFAECVQLTRSLGHEEP